MRGAVEADAGSRTATAGIAPGMTAHEPAAGRVGDDARVHELHREASRAPGEAGARRVLLLLGLAAIIPTVLLVAWTMFVVASKERDAARQAALDTTARAAERVSSDLVRELQVLETLAASPALEEGDLAEFYEHALRLARRRPLWETVYLSDSGGRQILNVLEPLGQDLGRDPDPASFDTVVRENRPVIGGLAARESPSSKALVALRVPVKREGRLVQVLTVGLDPGAFGEVLRQAGAPPDWIGGILDASGVVVARTQGENLGKGRPAQAVAREAVKRGPSGFYIADTMEGVPVATTYRVLDGTDGWSVHFGIPRETLDGPVDRSLTLLVAGAAASLLLAAALASLAMRDIDHRRRAREERANLALTLSEERGAVAIEAAELGTWRWTAATGEVTGSSRTRALLDLPPAPGGSGEGRWVAGDFLATVHPEDRGPLREALRACLADQTRLDAEFRIVRSDGTVRWVRATGRLVSLEGPSGTGEPAAIHGVILDIDPAKRSELERRGLLRRLASAQEGERRRIARELHDQVGQTVTGLSLGLKGLERQIDQSETADAKTQIRWLQGLARDIGLDIHRASSDLRPTALDDFGLERALAALMADWGRRFGITAEFQAVGIDQRLSPEIETAVYRAVQEALTNVLKHAHATQVSVVLERRGRELRVVVEDDGRGFDPDDFASTGPLLEAPLGLSGIRERLALVNGRLRIESTPGGGTSLFMQLPLPAGTEDHG